MLITVIATVIVLGVLIFVHELGHFVTAKLVDIEVPRFSIGLGPKLWGFRRGETEYVISWLPLGGYVKMAGMEEMEQVEGGATTESDTTGLGAPVDAGLTSEEPRPPGPRDFEAKSLPARALVISAGVIMNVIFAFLVFAGGAFVWGVRQVPEAQVAVVHAERLPEGAEALASITPGTRVIAVGGERVEDWAELEQALAMAPRGETVVRLDDGRSLAVQMPQADSARAALIGALVPRLQPVIGSVTAGEPAEAAGLRPGDRILRAGGEPVDSWSELVTAVEGAGTDPLSLDIRRGEERLAVTVTPELQSDPAATGGVPLPRIGIGYAAERERPGLAGSIAHGADQTWFWISATTGFLVQLFSGDQSPRNLGGPILIGQVSGQVVRAGIEPFLNFMAIFSINLAVLNLLPIPILDGGHLVFLLVEAVRGRALSLNQRMRLTQVGFVFLLAIMVWALANDVLRLFGI